MRGRAALPLLIALLTLSGCAPAPSASNAPATVSPAPAAQARQTPAPPPASAPAPASPRTLMAVVRDGDALKAYIVGSADKDGFSALDPALITFDGKPLDDALRESDKRGTPASAYLGVGQEVRLYVPDGYAGLCDVLSLSYSYTEDAGDALTAALAPREAMDGLPENDMLALAGAFVNMVPRAVETTDGEDTLTLACDIDGDGRAETLKWNAGDEPTAEDEHPIVISRAGAEIGRVSFVYGDETEPLPPRLMDVNGDGVFELILSGEGASSYLSLYVWKNDRFVPTGLGYYEGP